MSIFKSRSGSVWEITKLSTREITSHFSSSPASAAVGPLLRAPDVPHQLRVEAVDVEEIEGVDQPLELAPLLRLLQRPYYGDERCVHGSGIVVYDCCLPSST